MTTPDEDEMAAMDLFNAIGLMPDVLVRLSTMDAWMLIAAIQLSYTHPQLGEPLKGRLWDLGHQLQRILEADPAVAELAEKGWHREYDVPVGTGGS